MKLRLLVPLALLAGLGAGVWWVWTHPLVLLAPAGALALAAVWWALRYARASTYRRRSLRMALRIRAGWIRLATMLGLTVNDATPVLARTRHMVERKAYRFPISKSRARFPRLRVRSDEYGVVIRATTVPKVGLAEWQKQTDHLANAWRAVRVTADQERPGVIRVRAVHRDPLIEPTSWAPTGAEPSEEDWTSWLVGRDEYAAPARLGLANIPGMVLSGLPGSGKTSLIGGQLLARYATSRRVAFVLVDGKGGGDYEAWRPRAAAYVEDELDQAAELWRRLATLRANRQKAIALPVEAGGLGTRNFWNVGPTEAWPWVVVIVDECQHFLREHKGNDQATKDKAALTAEIRGHVEDVVKKGRSAGMFVVLASQKTTGDAVPTAIRDVCPLLASYAQTTSAAAVAALGEDIRLYPDASPVELQGPEYVGVLVTKTQGMRGFTRVRTPYVSDVDQERIAASVAHRRVDPWALVPARRLEAVS